MRQNDLKATKGAKKSCKRVGRGGGSGHGNFSGRGCKGQKARSGGVHKMAFEGGQTPMSRKMPKLKGFKNSGKIIYQLVNLDKLNSLTDGTEITKEFLLSKRMIKDSILPVKILGDGEIAKKLIFKVDKISGQAAEKIKKAGGEIIINEQKKEKVK